VDALGAENVEALIMPSRFTAAMSVEDSITLAQTLGARHHTLPIDRPVDVLLESLSPLFAGLPADTTEENIQARCRGLLLMAVSNKTARLVLATGNKSEMAVGYATLYGDMAGGFAPLKDVFKTLVYRLCRWRNTERPDIPPRIIERAPSAELRPDQRDEDTLPPYDVLDAILERYIELDRSTVEITSEGFDAETVNQVARMVDRNEYKRRQGAPGIKITERAFGRDRRYPITSAYREF
jgi:NAD+ synthase (glutamine-hydrolysing)